MIRADKLTLGAHMSVAGGLHNALLIAKSANCQCVQLFSANQRQWHAKPLTTEQIDLFKKTSRQTALSPLVVHASYLINLAAVDRTTLARGLRALKEEFQRCDQLGIDFLVLHPGAHLEKGEKAGLKKIVTSLNRVLQDDWNCRLLLETTAGQGTSLGHRFDQLAAIIENIERPDRLGVCLDTCHVFAAGYDLRTPSAYRDTIRQFDKTIGLSRLKVVHINDSKTGFNSRVDRHEHIAKGRIGRAAFGNLMTDPRITKLPLILETPKGKSPAGRDYDKQNLATLRRLSKH